MQQNSKFRYDIKTFMPCRYTEKNDLIHRINGTLITYDGVIYVAQLSNFPSPHQNKLCWNLVSPLSGDTIKLIEVNDPKLDISVLEVGYYTDVKNNGAYYLWRTPAKRYTQGMAPGNTSRKTIDGYNAPPWEIYNNIGLLEMFYNKYPQIQKALDILETKKLGSIALSRNVALQRTDVGLKMVYVKMVNVGYLTEGNRFIMPERKNSWLVKKYVNDIF